MEIVEFLTARLDEDELFAREATPGPWSPERPMLTDVVTSALLGRVADCSVGRDYRPQSLEDARHIARHDPARILCEVAAKRAIMAKHKHAPATEPSADDFGCEICAYDRGDCVLYGWGWCETVRLLAMPYADHPDYKPEWAVA